MDLLLLMAADLMTEGMEKAEELLASPAPSFAALATDLQALRAVEETGAKRHLQWGRTRLRNVEANPKWTAGPDGTQPRLLRELGDFVSPHSAFER